MLWALSGSRVGSSRDRTLRDLVKSVQQYVDMAAQDTSTVMALMHANYARAYLNAARSMATDTEIEGLAGRSFDAFVKQVDQTEAAAMARMQSVCKK